jgi:hypothetical protein
MSDGMAFERAQQDDTIHKIRFWLIVVMTGLFVSGITAFPLQSELNLTLSTLETAPVRQAAQAVSLLPWITRVHHAVSETNTHTRSWHTGRTGSPLPIWCSPFYSSVPILTPFEINGSSRSD